MQFCVECGTPNTMTARYCVKCQTLLVLTTAVREKAPRLKWSARKKAIAFGSPVLLLAGLIVIGIPKPSAVAVDIAVEAPFGGIFDEQCTLTEGARAIGAAEAEVVDAGVTPGSGTKTGLVYDLVDGNCVATANLSLYPETNYDLYVAGELAGSVTADEIASGVATKIVSLQITHDLKGTITLSEIFRNCKQDDSGTNCDTRPASDSMAARFDKAAPLCSGINKFSDFKAAGTAITVTGLATGEAVKGVLSRGVPSIIDYATNEGNCDFTFELTGLIHDDKGYRIKVGRHNAEPASISDLEASAWVYDYEFKG